MNTKNWHEMHTANQVLSDLKENPNSTFPVTTGVARRPEALEKFLRALTNLQVGGNQAANASELIPAVLAWRFHKAPGAGGLYLGAGLNFEPDEPVDLKVLDTRCANLGLTCEKAGEGQSCTIIQGIEQMVLDSKTFLSSSKS